MNVNKIIHAIGYSCNIYCMFYKSVLKTWLTIIIIPDFKAGIDCGKIRV